MKKFGIFFVILACLLVSGVLFAQTSTNQNIRGYYVVVNGQSTGPYDTQGLTQLVNQGLLNRNTLVWREGMPNWVVAGTVNELAPMFVSEPPPPPLAPPPPLVSSSQPEPSQTAPPPAASSQATATPPPPPPASQAASSSTAASTSRQAAAPTPKTGLFSVGGGALWDWSFNNGLKVGNMYTGFRNMSIGVYGFFDATYGEVDFYAAYGFMNDVEENTGSATENFGIFQIGFTGLGKYPFKINSNIVLFPLLGIDYNIVLFGVVDGEVDSTDASLFNQLGFLAGGGIDYFITDSLFLRGEALFHLRLPTRFMTSMALLGASATVGMGPQVKVGLGYKF